MVTMQNLQTFANQFVESTRDYIFIRPEDSLVIMRPNKTHHLNEVAREMLSRLYAQPVVDVEALVNDLAGEYGEQPEVLEHNPDMPPECRQLIILKFIHFVLAEKHPAFCRLFFADQKLDHG